MELRQPPNTTTTTDDPYPYPKPETNPTHSFFDDFDSTCSTPYVSAPSSPGRGSGSTPIPIASGFYYSAPASPMHFALTTTNTSYTSNTTSGIDFEFGSLGSGSDSSGSNNIRSADELFLNGKIRPMKLSTHLEKPQVLTPLLDLEEEEENEEVFVIRGRDLSRDKSVRGNRRTRSLSPLRSSGFSKSAFQEDVSENNNNNHNSKSSCSTAKSDKQKSKGDSTGDGDHGLRSSGSRRWVFLKDFLRSKSEGRSSIKYFWLPNKEKKNISAFPPASASQKPVNGIGGVREKKRRVPISAHELHYTANRAQAEEMKKRTFLPYKQGLLGCIGFSSKGYGAMSGFARALNPVSSR